MTDQEALLTRPGRIKAFGIMHMVFGGLTVLMVVLGFALKPLMMGMYRGIAENAATEEERVQAEMQLKLQEDLAGYNLGSYAVLLVLAIILVVAGLQLLQSKRRGQSLSILWSWLALAGTGVWFAISMVVILPKMTEIMGPAMEQAFDGSGSTLSEAEMKQAADTTNSVITVVFVIAMVISALLSAVYPLISLVMLRKKEVGEWMAQNGS
jgi:hypothetical protein